MAEVGDIVIIRSIPYNIEIKLSRSDIISFYPDSIFGVYFTEFPGKNIMKLKTTEVSPIALSIFEHIVKYREVPDNSKDSIIKASNYTGIDAIGLSLYPELVREFPELLENKVNYQSFYMILNKSIELNYDKFLIRLLFTKYQPDEKSLKHDIILLENLINLLDKHYENHDDKKSFVNIPLPKEVADIKELVSSRLMKYMDIHPNDINYFKLTLHWLIIVNDLSRAFTLLSVYNNSYKITTDTLKFYSNIIQRNGEGVYSTLLETRVIQLLEERVPSRFIFSR